MKLRAFSLCLLAFLTFFLWLGLSFQQNLPTIAQVAPVENTLIGTEQTATTQHQQGQLKNAIADFPRQFISISAKTLVS
jgi:hypothetical protein